MKQISELQTTLYQSLDWNKARIACLIEILQGLFLVRTVNLTQIAEAFQTEAKTNSSYRRVQRFFQKFSFDMSFVVILVCRLFMLGEKCVLIMDRTNWKWGKKDINILMLSVEHFGIGIPVFWMVLKNGGTSACKHRVKIMKRVLKAIGVKNIRTLLADREFIGEPWFRFLIKENIPFVIRVKRSYLAGGIRRGYHVPLGELLKKRGRRKSLINHSITLWGHSLFASAEHTKNAKEPMIVVSNRSWELQSPLELYRWRWGIETLFGCLKSRGFSMEDTHMTNPDKIEKLLFVLAIAVCWAYKTGELQSRKIAIAIKTHGRRAKSIFRIGLDLIRQTLFKSDFLLSEGGVSLLPYLLPLNQEVSL